MDVFIPEEYMMRRRMERRASTAGKKPDTEAGASGGAGQTSGQMTVRPTRVRTFDSNQFSVPAVPGESIVFSCFSA
ncbi:C2 NT-type domain-containing protein [Psidium guajava]|nr:C2 NT-type domain-containing protein [Psidium guajava]